MTPCKSSTSPSHRGSAQFAALIILTLCVFGQAVYAKASHYEITTQEARHFSTSVKIADLDGHAAPIFHATHQVVAPTISIHEPQTSDVVIGPENQTVLAERPVRFRSLRSPPAFSWLR